MKKTGKDESLASDEIDELDLRILDALQRNPPLSTAELADKVGLSQSPCWRRLTDLKQKGYIRDQITRLSAEKLGFAITIFASVRLTAHGKANLNEFSDAIERFPEVLEAYAIMGPFDFLLRIVARDVEAYRQFVYSKLSSLPTVQEINSTMAMGELKSTTAIPIRLR
jgi:Lrp/AsnC family transcriptional regulator